MLQGRRPSIGEAGSPPKAPPCTAVTPSRIFILSDVRLFREGLTWSLSHQPDIEVVEALAPGPGVIAQITGSHAVAVLLDISMLGALDICRELNRRTPGIKIVAFAVNEVDCELVMCAEAGIHGYVTRDGSVKDVVIAIQCAVRGEIACSPRVAALLFQRVATLWEATHGVQARPMLTRREREIARLLTEGLSNKEIARSLRISSATVKNHVHNVLEKLQIHRRSEAAARLRRENSGEADTGSSPRQAFL
jgi:two-component system, NarL family, nitrate/nitrite response regulator NarL